MTTFERTALHIRLVEDVVFSETPATAGGHCTLDYVPGASLLGAAAARLYEATDEDSIALAFARFHSGQVRFGNGYPLKNGRISYPAPLCIHYYKDEKPEPDKRLDYGGFFIGSPPDKNRQSKQLRKAFVNAQMERPDVRQSFSLKTAINDRTGRAYDARLFSYNALKAGQDFVAVIEGESGHINAIKNALLEKIWLGRSRSAEYGTVEITCLPEAPQTLPGTGKPREISLWALSDLCLHDKNGDIVTNPELADFGIGPFKVNWERTFIRTRNYTPFNGKWKSRAQMRSVIEMGSVITLNEVSGDEAVGTLAGGIGLFREAGLGNVWVNAPILKGGKPQAWDEDLPLDLDITADKAALEDKVEETPLIVWLKKQADNEKQISAARDSALKKAGELVALYDQAQSYQACQTKIEVKAPSPTQWSAVGSLAATAKNQKDLKDKLFNENNGLCRKKDDIWGARYERYEHENKNTFYNWLRDISDKDGDQAIFVIQELSKEAVTRVKEWLAS